MVKIAASVWIQETVQVVESEFEIGIKKLRLMEANQVEA